MRFSEKTVLVTGGACGIGKAAVKRFRDEGARVAFFDLNDELALQTVAELGAEHVLYVRCDISDEAQIRESVDKVVARFGDIDILVNNARAAILKSIDATVEDWELMLRVNIMGQALVCKHVVESMKKRGGGAIVNLGSISGVIAQWHQLTYNVTKAAMIEMSRCLALDLKDFNIRVNTVSPGWVMTENVHDLLYNQWKLNEAQIKEKVGDQHLLGRVARSEEIASVIAFLASDESSFITGANIMADGGYTVR
jgi:dihydroanticapsin dehydrogenase